LNCPSACRNASGGASDCLGAATYAE
jgi:hypothetical protein